MKKLIKVSLIFLLIFFVNSIPNKATTTATVNLTSNRDFIENGEEVEISFNITGEKTAAYFAEIYFDDTKLDFVSGPENVLVDKNYIKILWYDARWRKRSKTRGTR